MRCDINNPDRYNLYTIRANNKSPIGAIRSLGSKSKVQSSRSQEDRSVQA